MAILAPLDSQTASAESMAIWQRAGQVPETSVLNLVRLWAYSPHLQRAHQRLGDYLHNRTSVSRRLKEVAIVRACMRGFSRYELFHHVPLALASGLTQDEVDAISSLSSQYESVLGDPEAAIVQFADELLNGRGISELTWRRLSAHLPEPQLLEIALQSEYWYGNARFTRTLDAPYEPWVMDRRSNGTYGANPRENVSHVGNPAVDGIARIGLADVANAAERTKLWSQQWLDREPELPALVRLWARNEDLQVCYQQTWDVLFSDQVTLPPTSIARLAIAVARANHSAHVEGMVRTSCERRLGVTAPAADMFAGEAGFELDFVLAWDAGAPLGDAEVQRLLEDHTPGQVIELQLLAGLIGGQSRIAVAFGLG